MQHCIKNSHVSVVDISERAQKHKNRTQKKLLLCKEDVLQILVKRRGVAAQCKTSGLYHSTSNHSFYFTPFCFHFPFPPAFCMSLSVTYFLPALPWDYTGWPLMSRSHHCFVPSFAQLQIPLGAFQKQSL